MDLIEAERTVAATVRAASAVDPRGTGTHREVGGPPPADATPVRAPAGVVSYDPEDLTVCVGAGTTVGELVATLATEGQECALDPRDPSATVGGTLAVGLSGTRRLRVGPLRDQVLEIRLATADGRLVRGGGPTVKNVTGYDLPRLLVGSFGTLGVFTRVILRCRPQPAHRWWGTTTEPPIAVAARCYRPSSILWDGADTRVLLEGNVDDVDAVARTAGLVATDPPQLPDGPHRGRAAVPPSSVESFGRALGALDDLRWTAEIGIGTVHVATDSERALGRAREEAGRVGGWLLREAGAPTLDGFGIVLPNVALTTRLRDAFDPDGKLASGRLPFPAPDHRPLRESEVGG